MVVITLAEYFGGLTIIGLIVSAIVVPTLLAGMAIRRKIVKKVVTK